MKKMICDICKKEYADEMEIQEFVCIDFVGGYKSVFGDGNHVKCDICQYCLKKLIYPYTQIYSFEDTLYERDEKISDQ